MGQKKPEKKQLEKFFLFFDPDNACLLTELIDQGSYDYRVPE